MNVGTSGTNTEGQGQSISQAVAVARQASSSNAPTRLPLFSDDSAGYLRQLVNREPSQHSLMYLAGTVASCMKDTTNPHLSALYLQAAARHLTAEGSQINEQNTAKQVLEIAEAVGFAVAHCSPRSIISQCGILPALAAYSCFQQSYPTSSSLPPVLTIGSTTITQLNNVQVEFLQACIHAQQYRYAERLLADTWPRPFSGSNVRQVLRYFYLRGTVHIGCSHWLLAKRCFWTCLSIPSDIVSAIALAAWKKLVLVQCLLLVEQTGPNSMSQGVHFDDICSQLSPLRIPKATPSCFSRLLNTAFEPSRQNQQQSQQQAPENEPMHVVETFQGEVTSVSSLVNQQQPNYFLAVKAYRDIVKTYMNIDRLQLNQFIEENTSVLVTDGNLGLAKQVQEQLYRRMIYLASRIYSGIPLQYLADQLALPVAQTQTLLLEMVLDRCWPVEIIDDTLVRFPQRPPNQRSSSASSFSSLLQIAQVVQELNVAVAASPKYAAIVRRETNAAANNTAKTGQPRGVEDV